MPEKTRTNPGGNEDWSSGLRNIMLRSIHRDNHGLNDEPDAAPTSSDDDSARPKDTRPKDTSG